MTPTLARMVAAHERHYKKPIKWFAIPQLFRYERQQKGRLREHFQFNADLIGEAGPAAEAELLALLIDTLRAFGLTAEDFVVRLSSRNAWQDFFRQRSPRRRTNTPFSKSSTSWSANARGKRGRNWPRSAFPWTKSTGSSRPAGRRRNWRAIVANLQARGLGEFVKIDYHVIRGLAYYTGVVFEAFDKKGDFRAIAGGGRYDNCSNSSAAAKWIFPRWVLAWATWCCWNCSRRAACCQNLDPPSKAGA